MLGGKTPLAKLVGAWPWVMATRYSCISYCAPINAWVDQENVTKFPCLTLKPIPGEWGRGFRWLELRHGHGRRPYSFLFTALSTKMLSTLFWDVRWTNQHEVLSHYSLKCSTIHLFTENEFCLHTSVYGHLTGSRFSTKFSLGTCACSADKMISVLHFHNIVQITFFSASYYL